MYLARAYYNKGEYITAISEFTRVVDRHRGIPWRPRHPLVSASRYVAQSPNVQRDQTFTVQAWNACQNTFSDFRGSEVAGEAEALRNQMETKLAEKIFVAGDFYYRRKLYHSGIVYFNDLLSQYPGNKWAAQALLRLHQSYSALGLGYGGGRGSTASPQGVPRIRRREGNRGRRCRGWSGREGEFLKRATPSPWCFRRHL